LRESLGLFDLLCNSEWFQETPIFIFFNKMDHFQEKIRRTPLETFFPEFTEYKLKHDILTVRIENEFKNFNGRKSNVETVTACKFIMEKFLSCDRRGSKLLWPFLTCATDSKTTRRLFQLIYEQLLSDYAPNY